MIMRKHQCLGPWARIPHFVGITFAGFHLWRCIEDLAERLKEKTNQTGTGLYVQRRAVKRFDSGAVE
jgi:hypothetical protein